MWPSHVDQYLLIWSAGVSWPNGGPHLYESWPGGPQLWCVWELTWWSSTSMVILAFALVSLYGSWPGGPQWMFMLTSICMYPWCELTWWSSKDWYLYVSLDQTFCVLGVPEAVWKGITTPCLRVCPGGCGPVMWSSKKRNYDTIKARKHINKRRYVIDII